MCYKLKMQNLFINVHESREYENEIAEEEEEEDDGGIEYEAT